ncbi:transcription factor IIF subunit tfg1 [Vermiconidia calcicola]|uniref:Transcription factor IIF subunit tfg1 n=1 Tax=Vermiconidia calcicola TaxID=1690605 RepID=A0ACC3MWS8_9PEZI|nr:transcription factor IIF subunit tfg1 [Vermiconidia calcicola]
MSASPAKQPSGPNATTPNGSGPAMRKKAPVSIFTQKKKPAKKPPQPAQRPAAPSQGMNGGLRGQPMTNGVNPPAVVEDAEKYNEYPIYVSKEQITEGLHYHAMKLHSKANQDGVGVPVNPYEESQFTRPVRLHRRNARDKMEIAEQSDAASGMDDKEREQMSIKRAERQAEREANQALIAPTGGDPKNPQKRKKPQKKVEDVYFDENNPKQKARAQLRYEEARPWHLEDFEGKNTWVGNYEEPPSNSSVMFEIGVSGFRMVPVEKWYKFSERNRFSVMDSDAVEKHMSKKVKAPRWFLGTQQANDDERKQKVLQMRKQRQAEMRGGDDDEQDPFMKREDYQADVDEIDFEFNDEFQDDDEGFMFGDQQDEDQKEIEKRIREEQRTANLGGTGVKDEDKDWDAEEEREKRAEQDEKRRTKRMRRQLIKKERKNEYDSDSDRGEFSESEESEDSEEERERLEEERKQEEIRKLNGDKSGASSKGTNTPTGRSDKRDTSKSFGASLKRPGSPDLSEMSGNESSRKKVKGANGRAVSSAPNGARSLSPETAKPKRTGAGGYGSGSDTDTSRTGRPKIRLRNTPPASPHEGNTPTASRTVSPSGTGSRAQSPQRKAPTFPTLEEVRGAIPPNGIDLRELANIFKPRVIGRQPEFIALVKMAGKQDNATKRIMRKEERDVPRPSVER